MSPRAVPQSICISQDRLFALTVDALDENKVAEALEKMRLGYLETARQLPGHSDFIAATEYLIGIGWTGRGRSWCRPTSSPSRSAGHGPG